MGWYLVLILYSTTDLLVKPFPDKKACEKYLSAHKKEFRKDKDIKLATCEEGVPVNFEDTKSEDFI